MGGKSSSSSSSSTSQTYTNNYDIDDYRLAQEQGAIGATSGGTVNITDGGLAETVADFGKYAFETAGDLGKGAFDLSKQIIDKNTDVLMERVEDNAKSISETLIKGLFATVAIGAIMWGLKKK
tara:strand:+ start:6639 stop:7007 length:369 start_codon:yes stop_codon:yes gene_type:complete